MTTLSLDTSKLLLSSSSLAKIPAATKNKRIRPEIMSAYHLLNFGRGRNGLQTDLVER